MEDRELVLNRVQPFGRPGKLRFLVIKSSTRPPPVGAERGKINWAPIVWAGHLPPLFRVLPPTMRGRCCSPVSMRGIGGWQESFVWQVEGVEPGFAKEPIWVLVGGSHLRILTNNQINLIRIYVDLYGDSHQIPSLLLRAK